MKCFEFFNYLVSVLFSSRVTSLKSKKLSSSHKPKATTSNYIKVTIEKNLNKQVKCKPKPKLKEHN